MERTPGLPALVLLVGLAGLLLAAAPAEARTVLNVTSHDEGPPDSRAERPFWFTVEGREGRNPTIQLDPGEEVVVHYRTEGTQLHALAFREPVVAGAGVVEPGNSSTFRFTVPEDATNGTTYLCEFHGVVGEGGSVAIAGAEPVREELPMDRGDLIPYPPKRLTEYAFVGGQLTPAFLAVAAAILMARRAEP